jgi:hypothetical protein
MIESILFSAGILGAVGFSALAWFKIGSIEAKVDLIYSNLNIAIDWINKNNKK